MRLLILCIGIMHIVGSHQLDACLLAHPEERLIDQPLLTHAVILQLQKEISLPEDLLIPKGRFLSFFIHTPQDIFLYLARKACT